MPAFQVVKESGSDKPSLEVVEQDNLEAWGAGAVLEIAGKPHARLEGREKVTGSARYAYDTRQPRQLYARVLRSPHPHARISAIDVSRAEALPGVHAVLSVLNAPDMEWYEDGHLFERTVRFQGDEVAAVAAESEEIADDALRLIEVTYEPMPFVSTVEQAMAPGAPAVHEPGNIAGEPKHYERGDPDAGVRQAAVVIEEEYETRAAFHNALEPHGCTASWEGDDLTLWDSTQGIFAVRQQVAGKLGLPEHRVRVIKQFMGGGFGAKQISWKHDVIAALLSKQAGRPVQLMLDRVAENLAAGNRNPTKQKVTLAATSEGKLTAIVAEIHQSSGAYMTGGEASEVSGMYQTLYACPNVRTDQTAFYTNTGPAVAFRGPGHVEAAFALEQAMDELARKLDLDPVELRRRNYSETDQQSDKPYTLPEGLRLCYDRVSEALATSRKPQTTTGGTKRRGYGFAAHDWMAGGGEPPAYAWAELQGDGTAIVVTGAQDIGTGARTGLAQIAAEEFGLPLERINLQLGDTTHGPYAPTSAGSTTQASVGPAVRAAAAGVKQQLLEAASVLMETNVADLSVTNGQVMVAGSPMNAMAVEEIMQAMTPNTLQSQGARGPNREDYAARTFGAQWAEVEVDIETGETKVLRVITAHDCGRIINPALVDSQIFGGITQGVGYGLLEDRVVDAHSGVALNANLEEYKIPSVADVPVIDHVHVNVPDPLANALGAKGIGEPPLIPTAPAIANAIFDATGVRIRRGPITRRRLLDAIAAANTGAARETSA